MPLQTTISSPAEAALIASWIFVYWACGHATVLLTTSFPEGVASEACAVRIRRNVNKPLRRTIELWSFMIPPCRLGPTLSGRSWGHPSHKMGHLTGRQSHKEARGLLRTGPQEEHNPLSLS